MRVRSDTVRCDVVRSGRTRPRSDPEILSVHFNSAAANRPRGRAIASREPERHGEAEQPAHPRVARRTDEAAGSPPDSPVEPPGNRTRRDGSGGSDLADRRARPERPRPRPRLDEPDRDR
ncbi:hypothetical protein CDG81_01625 [Actinopolyspora erythraea]|uniref:Uncharacterized protein n=1 Tax=Actinopolyspora erythraea TaxID=414996 RepID=A0A099DB24_9ACTN|nr:hypothetical protein CDG81_01625 [Actinopolyspora erythraea]KGI83076.1 hypothetical protein IL38_00045 [Actinopolyspora erythraea]